MPDFAVKTLFMAGGNTNSTLYKMAANATLFGDKASKAFQKASSQGNIFRSVMGGLASYLSARMILKFADDSIKAWNESQEASANAAATIKSTNGIAGKSLQDLAAQAEAFQRNTFFEDDTIMKNVSSQMLTFTNITGKQFDRAQQSVLDVTAKLYGLQASGENLKGTTIQLSKALNDVRGMSALRKSGIMFTKEQETLAKRLYNTGRIAEYQNLVLTEIEKQYGGTAEALAKTNGGIELQTKNMIGSLQEVIGEGLAPIKLGLLTFARDGIAFALPYIQKLGVIVEKLLPPVQQLFSAVLEFGSFLWEMVTTILSPFIKKSTTLEDILNSIGGVIRFIADGISGWAKILKVIWPYLLGLTVILGTLFVLWNSYAIAQWAANVAMNANPIGLIITALGLLALAIGYAATHWNEVSKALQETWDKYKAFFAFIMPPIYLLIEGIKTIANAWNGIANSFKSGDILGGILRIGGALISNLLLPIQAFLDLISKIPGLGNISKGGAKTIADLRAGLEGGFFENNAPNKQEASARASGYRGDLFIHSQQPTNYVEKKSGSQPINVNMLGLNY